MLNLNLHDGYGCPEEKLEKMLRALGPTGAVRGIQVKDTDGSVRASWGEPFPDDERDEQPDPADVPLSKKKRRKRLLELQTDLVVLLTDDLTEARTLLAESRTQSEQLLRVLKERDDTIELRDSALVEWARHSRDQRTLVEDREKAVESLLEANRLLMVRLMESENLVDDLGVKAGDPLASATSHSEGNCAWGALQCRAPQEHPVLTETWAVPKCEFNRWEQVSFSGAAPAPYCVSEHCQRCNAYRRLHGVQELVPNGWLREMSAGEALADPGTQGALEALEQEEKGCPPVQELPVDRVTRATTFRFGKDGTPEPVMKHTMITPPGRDG